MKIALNILNRLKPDIVNKFIRRNRAFPAAIQISVSDVCNFHCTTCWIHGNKVIANSGNYEASLFVSSRPAIMDSGVYSDLINDMAGRGHRTLIQFCGKGEPTLNPSFPDMLLMANEKGFKTSLVTNGSRLTPDLLKALGRTQSSVGISLNAFDVQSHKAFTETDTDHFTHIVELLKGYHDSGRSDLNISLSFVIGSHNIAGIYDMVKTACSVLLPGSSISFFPEWTHSGNRENNVSQEQLKAFITKLPEIKAYLKKAKMSHNLDIVPYLIYCLALSPEGQCPTRDYYMKYPCTVVGNYMVIMADGRLVPCCRSSFVLGNITEQGIYDIWTSDRATQFRQQASMINKTGLELPESHCFSCDHLMGNKYFHERYCQDVKLLMTE